MKDTIDPILSDYSGVRWSAPDDATVEGEFPLAPISLRYAKAKRLLRLRLTEISALETWGSTSASSEQTLTGRGELAEVLTVFELEGGPVRQFRKVREVRLAPAPVAACAGTGRQPQADPDPLENTELPGAFFIDFEALRIHGEHPEPALNLSVTMELGEFNRVYSLVYERADEIKEVTLFLEADLFGDGIDLQDAWGGWIPEYGMLRPTDAPLAFVPARLERMEVILERSGVLGSGPAAFAWPGPDHLLGRRDPPDDRSSIIIRRLGWIIALLVVIIVILLSNEGVTKGTTRLPRQFAESPASAVMHIGSVQTDTLKTLA
jgi:hypothetical protein